MSCTVYIAGDIHLEGLFGQGVCVCVCVCVCVRACVRAHRLLQLLKDQLIASKSFYRLLVMFNSWICKIMLCSRVMPSFVYLECHCSLFRRVRSKTCPWSVAILLSIISYKIGLRLREWSIILHYPRDKNRKISH